MVNWSEQNRIGEEVIHSTGHLISLKSSDIDQLIQTASSGKRKRIRYCSHSDSEEAVQEMFIVHPKDAYVRPHRHMGKIESMYVLRGEVDYVVFDDFGNVKEVIPMGDLASDKVFYQSIRQAYFHTLLIRSEWLVFLEITRGPFRRKDTEMAEWSPSESDISGVNNYINNLKAGINNGFLSTSNV